MKSWGDYLFPNGVLRNKFNIQDDSELKIAEYKITTKSFIDMYNRPIVKDFSIKSYKKIHKKLFSEIYDWAGEFREVNIVKGGTTFCDTSMLDSYGQSIFDDLEKKNFFQNLEQKDLIDMCASFLSDINAWHPFREGNGRTQKLVLNYIANINGYEFQYDKISKIEWNKASHESFTDIKNTKLKEVLSNSIVPITLEKQNMMRKNFGLEPILINERGKGENDMAYKNNQQEKSKLPKNSNDYNEFVRNMFMDLLNKPAEEWVKGWESACSIPRNGVSGRTYTGINQLMLSMYMAMYKTKDPRFYPAGYVFDPTNPVRVNKDEKVKVVLKTPLFKYKDLNDGLIHQEHLSLLKEYLNQPDKYEVLPEKDRYTTKYTPLFHASQLNGIEAYKVKEHEEKQLDSFVSEALEAMGIPLFENIQAQCPYFTETGGEKICIPPMKNFINQEELDSSVLHELIHATGTESRLNRETLKRYAESKEMRAKEELVAEIGSVFALQQTNVKPTNAMDIKNHVSYVANWKEAISSDKGFEYLKEAMDRAQEASTYLCEKTNERILNKNWCIELRDTLEYEQVHVDRCGIKRENIPGGYRYTQGDIQLDIGFTPNTSKEDSCKLIQDKENPNHYHIRVLAKDTKRYDLINESMWQCLDDSMLYELDNDNEREK